MDDSQGKDAAHGDGKQEEVILVVGKSVPLYVLLLTRPSARIVVLPELRRALDYLRRNRVSRVFIEPSAFDVPSWDPEAT